MGGRGRTLSKGITDRYAINVERSFWGKMTFMRVVIMLEFSVLSRVLVQMRFPRKHKG